MSSNIVHRYLWRNHSLPIRKAWILTVTDAEALALFSFVTTLIAYTQSRAWHLERCIFNRLIAPKIQLPVADQRESLSQGAAIRILIRHWDRRRSDSTQLHKIRYESPWLGFIAIVNILGFVALGIVLPWSLSGGVEMPLVLSRNMGGCVAQRFPWDVMPIADENAFLADQTFKQCWRNRSEISRSCSRLDGLLAERPEIVAFHDDACPFQGETCKDNFQTVRLEHSSLSLRDFGVNSQSKISIGHRLTCSPIKTELFLRVPSLHDCKASSLSFINPNISDSLDRGAWIYTMNLMTCNGPNQFSDIHSGKVVAMDILAKSKFGTPQPQIGVWPTSKFSTPFEAPFGNEDLHPYLQTAAGKVFVVNYKAGYTIYRDPIDDPLFSAHQAVTRLDWAQFTGENATVDSSGSDEPVGFWMPDQEVTAIGCVEQYRVCNWNTPMPCTSWGSDAENILSDRLNLFSSIDNYYSTSDIDAAIHVLVHGATIRNYLLWRGSKNAFPVSEPVGGFVGTPLNANELWIEELKAWMEISLLNSRYMMMSIMPNNPKTWRQEPPFQWGNTTEIRCNRILFYDGDHTNFDFIQLLVVVCCFFSVCILSFERQLLSTLGKVSRYSGGLVDMTVKSIKRKFRCRAPGVQMRMQWPWQRISSQSFPQRYPRNPFQDPSYHPTSDVYSLDVIYGNHQDAQTSTP